MPTDRRVLYGHHFAAIAGAGPLVGPVLAAQMGYLPGTLWIILGVIFAGAVQDYMVLHLSIRRRGRSLGQMAREELGPIGGWAAIIGVLTIMIILIAVLGIVVIGALAQSPWGVYSIAMTIPIALFMGVYLRFLRPGKVGEVSAIGVALLLFAVISGQWVSESSWGQSWFTLSPVALAYWLCAYGFAASILPVWLLLAPRDYLSTFMKVGTIIVLAIGILVTAPVIKMPALTQFGRDGTGPAFAGSLFPFLFITIACGALSGFHALISSGTTPKLIEKESQARMMGYGGMLMESFVAVMAMVAAVSIDQHLYFAMNSPVGANGGTPEKAAAYLNSLGLVTPGGTPLPPADPAMLAQAAKDVGEASIIGRTGGAPTLAVGMSEIMHGVFGGPAWKSFWYHFAIMFEALFILTTVDAGTRVARFMFSDALSNVRGLSRFKDPSWTVGAWISTFIVVGGWGSILVMGVNDPLGGINTLYPLFGIANQLLAAIALTVVFSVIMKQGLFKWAWVPALPLVWDLAVTLTASYQKIFSSVPAIGYWANHEAFVKAKADGQDQFRDRKDPGRYRRRHSQHLRPGVAVDPLRHPGRRCRHRRDHGGHQGMADGRAAHERGARQAVADLRPEELRPDRDREGGARGVASRRTRSDTRRHSLTTNRTRSDVSPELNSVSTVRAQWGGRPAWRRAAQGRCAGTCAVSAERMPMTATSSHHRTGCTRVRAR
jgi:carbon starvation protein